VKDRLLLLHNLKDIEEVADVQKVVEEDIKGAFNATEGDNEGTYYTSQHFYHFIVRQRHDTTRHSPTAHAHG
jgi:type I restriction-modification system DNA methylase subunit